jgi:hypothetical protein
LNEPERVRQLGQAISKFATFCGLLQIVDFQTAKTRPFRFTSIQQYLATHRAKQSIVLKARKVYVSTLELAFDLWWFLTKPGARVTIVCQADRRHVTLRFFNSIMRLFVKSLRLQGLGIEFGVEAEGRWTLPSSDASMQIIEAGASYASAQKSGRGDAVNRLHLSEVASYEHGAETMMALVGSMPGGDADYSITIESTPNGSVGYFHDQWVASVAGETEYVPFFFPWHYNDDYWMELDPGEAIVPDGRMAELETRLIAEKVEPERIKWLRYQLRKLGGDLSLLMQDFPSDPESCFLESGEQYVPAVLIEQCTSYDPVPLVYGHAYAGIDFGRTNDLTVICTGKQDLKGHVWVTETRYCRRTDWATQMALIFQANNDWDWRRVALDVTGIGNMPGEMVQNGLGKDRTLLVNFSQNSKELLATTLYAALAEKSVTLQDDPDMARDVKSIKRIVRDSGMVVYDAPRTSAGHADRAWALALMLHAAGLRGPSRPARTDTGYGDYLNP